MIMSLFREFHKEKIGALQRSALKVLHGFTSKVLIFVQKFDALSDNSKDLNQMAIAFSKQFLWTKKHRNLNQPPILPQYTFFAYLLSTLPV